MKELEVVEVMQFIDKVGPMLGYDNTNVPVFPPGRKDVCVVVRFSDDGDEVSYDTVYVVWIEGGEMKCEEIHNTKSTDDYIAINSVRISPEGELNVNFGEVSFDGSPWNEEVKMQLATS